jgi:hypothetical protein
MTEERKYAILFAATRLVETKIQAVVEQTNGLHLQVDYGHDETALVHEKQVRKD